MSNQTTPAIIFPVSPLFQFSCMLVSLIAFLVILNIAYSNFRPSESLATLQSLSPIKIKMFGGVPANVTVGFYIERFATFTMLQGKFNLEGLLWFEFNPVSISIKEIENIMIDNGEILKKSLAFTKYLTNNKMLVCYHVQMDVYSTLKYHRFPIDAHYVSIWMTHRSLPPQELVFESAVSNLVVDARATQSGWQLIGSKVLTGYIPYILSAEDVRKDYNWPYLIFSLDYARTSLRDGLIIFFPLLFMFFLALCTLSLDPIRYFATIYGLTAGSITGMLGYRFVIENMSPKVGYFMISDYCFFLFLSLAFLVFFCNMFSSRFSKLQAQFLVAGIHLIFIISFAYILLG